MSCDMSLRGVILIRHDILMCERNLAARDLYLGFLFGGDFDMPGAHRSRMVNNDQSVHGKLPCVLLGAQVRVAGLAEASVVVATTVEATLDMEGQAIAECPATLPAGV